MIAEIEFTYCPKCGGNLQKKDNNLLVCSECDLHYYINPKPSNAVLLYNTEGKLLLVKRKHEPQKGFLDLPGGFVDINETIEESVQREMNEELGIAVENLQYVTSVPDRYEFGEINAYAICSAFSAKIPENARITIGDDVEDIVFVNKNQIPFDQIAFEGIKKLLMSFQRNEVSS